MDLIDAYIESTTKKEKQIQSIDKPNLIGLWHKMYILNKMDKTYTEVNGFIQSQEINISHDSPNSTREMSLMLILDQPLITNQNVIIISNYYTLDGCFDSLNFWDSTFRDAEYECSFMCNHFTVH